jgi:ubiquinone/menaquinone biosynthesis C-methylase UbiE
MDNKIEQPIYGNWISKSLIIKVLILFIFFLSIEILLLVFMPDYIFLKIIIAFFSLFFFISIIYFIYAKWLFSARGGDIQNKTIDLLIKEIKWDGKGKVLDIGCGSGLLAIKIAKIYNNAKITGIDYWGKEFNYCQKQCEDNARIENVDHCIEFLKASATNLPFADENFDLVISNLTFHEVRSGKNKIDLIKEALRVLKKGGKFVFQDLFLIKYYYGTPEQLISNIKALGVKEANFINTSQSSFIPKSLKLSFMLGTLGLICGEK